MIIDGKRLGAIAASFSVAALCVASTASSRAGAEAGPFTNCSSASPCVTDANSGTGPGLKSTSAKGAGLLGRTSHNSTSSANGVAGVNGTDGSSTGTFDSGVTGASTRGTGVIGTSASGNGVSGTATDGAGVVAISTNGNGAFANSTNSSGVIGSSTNSYGVVGITHGSGGNVAGVQGDNDSNTTAVRANGFGGDLFIGNATTGSDVFRVDNLGDVFASHQVSVGLDGATSFGLEADGTVEGVVGIGLSSGSAGVASTGVSGASMYIATNSSNTQTLRADDSGNLIITGLIFTAGGCSAGCVVNQKAPGTRIVTYAPREAAPTVEDVGEGQLVDGKSYVALDREFANVIDQHSSYFVFITPEGDNRGLFVTDKTLHGFSVHESQAGRSSLPFSYRIVAKPYGPTQPRLARVNFAAQPRLAPIPALAHVSKSP